MLACPGPVSSLVHLVSTAAHLLKVLACLTTSSFRFWTCATDLKSTHLAFLRSSVLVASARLFSYLDVAESTLSSPQSTSIGWSKLAAPGSNGFVGYSNATLSEQVLDTAKAQTESMVQPDGMADALGWKTVTSTQAFHRSIVAHRW